MCSMPKSKRPKAPSRPLPGIGPGDGKGHATTPWKLPHAPLSKRGEELLGRFEDIVKNEEVEQ